MNFGERAVLRRKSKDLKNELKQLKKDMISAGCEKAAVTNYIKEFGEALELGNSLQTEYEAAGEHLRQARESIRKLLDCMGESPASEVQESLLALVKDLDQVYHDCSIREDDLDFKSTISSLKQMVTAKPPQEYSADGGGMSAIMLRSELENIQSVLDDTAGWNAPDFLALAYFCLHEDKDALKEMENEQRNRYVLTYLKEHFMDTFLRECGKAGMGVKAKKLVQSYIYES